MDNDLYYGPSPWVRRMMYLVSLVVAAASVYVVVAAIITANNTGVLTVHSDPKGTIIISQATSQAEIIGDSGKAQVRLKPGVYQVVSTASDGKQAAKVVSVEKKRSTDVSLSPNVSPKLRSLSDVTFFGTSTLVNNGVTLGQIDTLKLDFFKFDTSATSVRIDTQSVRTAPHTLGSPFVITFTAIIGPRNYSAKVSYSDTENIRLQLYDPHNGQLVYDSYTPANVKNLD